MLNPLDAVLQLEAAGVGGGGAGVARVVRQLGEGGPVVAPQQQHAAGGGPGHVVLPVILKHVHQNTMHHKLCKNYKIKFIVLNFLLISTILSFIFI